MSTPRKVIVTDNFANDPADIAEVTSGAENTADVVTMSPTPLSQDLVRWLLNGGFGGCASDVPVTNSASPPTKRWKA